MLVLLKQALILALLLIATACSNENDPMEETDSRLEQPLITLEKEVVQARKAANNYAWTSRFSYQFFDKKLMINLRVSLSTVENVRSLEMEDAKKRWLDIIDKKWNNRLGLVLSNGAIYPIQLNVRFSPINPDHHVLVRKGTTADQHNWTINMPVAAAAHEIGHMLGAFDEYKFGALSLDEPEIDGVSIMGSRIDSGYPYPRHLSLMLNDLKNELNDSGIKITLI